MRAKNIQTPIIGDFHFNGHLLLTNVPECAKALDKYRINPGNVALGSSGQNHFEQIIKIPSLQDLAAMKAYALGGRAKWKDYVDLYFLLKDHFNLNDVSSKAKNIFGNYFNEKLFREQLSYFKDIDYREQIEFTGKEIKEDAIKEYLTKISITPF